MFIKLASTFHSKLSCNLTACLLFSGVVLIKRICGILLDSLAVALPARPIERPENRPWGVALAEQRAASRTLLGRAAGRGISSMDLNGRDCLRMLRRLQNTAQTFTVETRGMRNF